MEKETKELVITKEFCPYCDKKAKQVEVKFTKHRKYGYKHYEYVQEYLCPTCNRTCESF